MIYYLMGMPGCGKTTLGKKLSEKLSLNFIDLDAYIEEKAGMTIPKIFSFLGEEKFRELEKEAVLESTSWKNTIVACGGGAPCFHDNMETMNYAGKTIYINVSPLELHRRLMQGGQSKRPLLKNKTPEDLLLEIQQKKNDRDSYYMQAQIVLFNNSLQVGALERILKKVKD